MNFVPSKNEEPIQKKLRKKRMNLLLSVFAILGYAAD
jgi:hypothetical protein